MNKYQLTSLLLVAFSGSSMAQTISPDTNNTNIIIGNNASVKSSTTSISMGYNASANGNSSISEGYQSAAHGASSVAIGVAAKSIGEQAAAFGSNATTEGNSSSSFGSGSIVKGIQAEAFGATSHAIGDNAVAFGSGAHANGRYAIALGTNAKSQTADIAIGNYAKATGTRGSIAIGNGSQSTDGQVSFGNAHVQRRLENVHAGIAATDAVNVSQLSQEIKKTDLYTDQKSASTLTTANQYTDKKINQLHLDLNKVHDQANAGIASAMAMSSIPMKQGYHYTLGMGVANYDNQSAIAVGGKFDVSQHSILTLAASDNSQHDSGVAAGVGFGF